jgi:TetR/AcrR family transcriptional repressor of nem operon
MKPYDEAKGNDHASNRRPAPQNRRGYGIAPLDPAKTSGHIQSMPRESVKEPILAAAVKVLRLRGFNATGVQDITDAAGVPKGSFYNHFESKEALGIEALDRYWDGVLRSLETLEDKQIAPIVRLKTYFHKLNLLARKSEYRPGCFIGNMSAEMSDQSPAFRKRLSAIFAAWSRAIETCVKQAQADGSVRRDLDAKSIAAFLLNSWEGAVLRSKVDRGQQPLDIFEKFVFTALAK